MMSLIPPAKKGIGIIGGLGPLAGADTFMKLVKATPAQSDQGHLNLVLEQQPLTVGDGIADELFKPNARKMHVFNLLKQLESRNLEAVMLPCFISHTFLNELEEETSLSVINLMEALAVHVNQCYPHVLRIGVLTSSFVMKQGLFESYFQTGERELIYPSEEVQKTQVMEAIYGTNGIKAGQFDDAVIKMLQKACQHLVERGAEIIIPGFTEIPAMIERLGAVTVPIIDANLIYARYALESEKVEARLGLKLGIIGGVGPAATVDFMNKVIANTPADVDQDHIKMLLVHNPKIPDRTENLIGDGRDPTIPLYAAAKQLEEAGADMIVVPCNTAHAFMARIQSQLSVPFINMLTETMDYVRRNYGSGKKVGLLATTGTVESRIYHEAAVASGYEILVPDESNQAKVMSSIYGPRGAKAGYTEGACRTELLEAAAHLVQQGADVLLLGCTELPLILSQNEAFPLAGKVVAVLDPTEILARQCVSLVV